MKASEENRPRYAVLVIGANGGVGAQIVLAALERGHSITAIVRSPDKMKVQHPNLTILKGDVLKPDTIRGAFLNKDVVISAIGSNSRKETTLYSQAAKNVLDLMKSEGVTRCFFVSAFGLDVNPSFNFLLQWLTRNILQRILKEMYMDLRRMERLVKESDLNWTIMRPPRLTNSAATGKYRFSIDVYLGGGTQISRADLADFMLTNIENASIFRTTVEVGY